MTAGPGSVRWELGMTDKVHRTKLGDILWVVGNRENR